MTPSVPPIKKQLLVNTSVAQAFRVFTAGMNRWWPREHHIGTAPLKEVIVEPRAGGRWYSISEDGSECDTGKVLVWEPPRRVVLSWQITAEWKFDPTFVTEVEAVFTAEGPHKTRVDFEHRGLERYGAAAEAIRKQLDDPKGWHGNLDGFARTAGMKAVLIYESSADVLAKAPLHFAAHKARLDVFAARGELLAVGTWADPREGSMSVFASREAAEDFVREDPFVLNGVVARHTIKDWNETMMA